MDDPSEEMLAFTRDMHQRNFDAGVRWPLSWLLAARPLWRASEECFAIYRAAAMREEKRWHARLAARKATMRSHVLKGDELEDHYRCELLRVHFLLAGLAVENVLKGLISVRQPHLIFDSDGVAKPRKAHDLTTLARMAGVPLAVPEELLVAKLSRCVEWQGLYTIPLEAAKLAADPRELSELPSGILSQEVAAKSMLDALYVRLLQDLEECRRLFPEGKRPSPKARSDRRT